MLYDFVFSRNRIGLVIAKFSWLRVLLEVDCLLGRLLGGLCGLRGLSGLLLHVLLLGLLGSLSRLLGSLGRLLGGHLLGSLLRGLLSGRGLLSRHRLLGRLLSRLLRRLLHRRRQIEAQHPRVV